MGNFCHFRAQKMGQNRDSFQNFTKAFLGEGYEAQNNCR